MVMSSRYKVEERNTDNYVILNPVHEHKFSLIWLHGLGDSAYGFLDVFTDQRFKIVPETCKVILPTAPKRPVTCNGGMKMTSWYDILSLDRSPAMTIDENL